MCCQVEVSARSWSLVQRSPTDCGASLCVIWRPQERGHGPRSAAGPQEKCSILGCFAWGKFCVILRNTVRNQILYLVSIFCVIGGKIFKFYIFMFTDSKYLIRTILKVNIKNLEQIIVWKWMKYHCQIKLYTISHDFPRCFDATRWVTLYVYLRTSMWMKEVWKFVIKIKCHGIIWLYFSLWPLCHEIHTRLCHRVLYCHGDDICNHNAKFR
jgi:hypothetical protein